MLVDKESSITRANRPKKDLNKITLTGVVNYTAFLIVLLISLTVNLCMPTKYLLKPYSEEFFNITTVNQLITVVSTLCFTFVLFAEAAVSVISFLRKKDDFGKATRIFIVICAVLIIIVTIGISETLTAMLFETIY